MKELLHMEVEINLVINKGLLKILNIILIRNLIKYIIGKEIKVLEYDYFFFNIKFMYIYFLLNYLLENAFIIFFFYLY
jgi:hypothetical protein